MPVKLNKNEDVTYNDKEVTSTKRYISGFQTSDGQTDPEAEKAFQETYAKPIYSAYDVDPETHKFKGTLTDLIGVDPEETKKRNQAKIEAEEKKRKANNFFVLGSHIIDAVGGLTGAKVQKHDFGNTNEKANENIKYLQSLNDAQDALVAKEKYAREKSAEDAVLKAREKFAEKYGYTITNQQTTGGGKHVEGYREEQPRVGRSTASRSYSGSGGDSKKNVVVAVHDGSGVKRVYVNTACANSYIQGFKAAVTPLLDQPMPGTAGTYLDYLKKKGVISDTESTSSTTGGSGLRSTYRENTRNIDEWKWNDKQILAEAYNWSNDDLKDLVFWLLENSSPTNEGASAPAASTAASSTGSGASGGGRMTGGGKKRQRGITR